MRIHTDSGDFKYITNPVVTVGTFDGIHRGHLSVIRRLTEIATALYGESVVITFNPHPRQVLLGDNSYKVLCTFSEKKGLLGKAGVNHMVVFPFTVEFAALTFGDFVRQVLVDKLHAKAMVIGYDHHFGNKREGNFEKLKPLAARYGVELYQVLPEEVEKAAVSSTNIRKALLSGKMKEANAWLGYEYSMEGKVIKGNMIGRKLDYHTANIQPDDDAKLIPARGVYAVTVVHEEIKYRGMLNIGIRPTINDKKETIEVHILDFNKDIYGHDLKVVFHEYVREEKRFDHLEALKTQLDNDKIAVIKIFEERRVLKP